MTGLNESRRANSVIELSTEIVRNEAFMEDPFIRMDINISTTPEKTITGDI